MENPLQWLLRINQEKGGAVLDALGNIPNVIQEIPGRIQQGADNLLKIGQDSLDQVVKTSIEQQEQRKANLEAGGVSELKQRLSYNAEALAEAATGAGWLDLAGMALAETSGADWMPEALRLPLLIGGIGLSAADGTPPPLSPKQLNRLSRVSSTASNLVSGPKVNALDRYDELVAAGYDMSKDTTIQRLINKVDNADNLPKHIKQHTDEAAYKIAVDEHIAKGNPTAKIREKVGVLVGEDGSVRQWESRGKMQLRGEGEATNTALNRELDRFLQSPQFVSYNRIANVRHFMKEIGFTGTEKQFRAMYELHHVNAIKVYSPFFAGLKPKQAEKLRRLAEGTGIYLGNDPRNLVPLLKRKHTLDKDSIHTFMRENGIEGSSKWPFLSTEGNKLGSYDPQARMAALLEGRSVQERFEVLKGFQEWVQKPALEHLSTLTNTKPFRN